MKHVGTAVLNVVGGLIGMAIWLAINYLVVTQTTSNIIILLCRFVVGGVIVLSIILQNTKVLRKRNVESAAVVFIYYFINICMAMAGAYGCGYIFQNYIMSKL